MSWQHVLQRDLTSVFRARTGATILSFTLLMVLLPTWFVYSPDLPQALPVALTLVAVGLMLVLAVLGRPGSVTLTAAGFTGILLVLTMLSAEPTVRSSRSISNLMLVTGSSLSFLVPLFGLLGSYGAIVGERTTGSMRFLLGLPNSRADAYAGKFLSRTGVVGLAVVLGLGLLGVILLAVQGPGAVVRVIGLGLLTLPYVVIFVGIGLAASAIADTETQAVGIVVGVFALLRAGWPAVQWLLVDRPPYGAPEETVAYFWVGRVNPINAYVKGTTMVLDADAGFARHPLLTTPRDGLVAPVAQSTEFALVVLALWTVVTPLVGYWLFEQRDVL